MTTTELLTSVGAALATHGKEELINKYVPLINYMALISADNTELAEELLGFIDALSFTHSNALRAGLSVDGASPESVREMALDSMDKVLASVNARVTSSAESFDMSVEDFTNTLKVISEIYGEDLRIAELVEEMDLALA